MKNGVRNKILVPLVRTLVRGKVSQKDAEYVWRLVTHRCGRVGLPGLPLMLRFRFVTKSLGVSVDGGEYVGKTRFNGTIEISAKHWRMSPQSERRRLILHEVAHVAEFLTYGMVTFHGRGFRTMMRRLGIVPDKTDLQEAGNWR